MHSILSEAVTSDLSTVHEKRSTLSIVCETLHEKFLEFYLLMLTELLGLELNLIKNFVKIGQQLIYQRQEERKTCEIDYGGRNQDFKRLVQYAHELVSRRQMLVTLVPRVFISVGLFLIHRVMRLCRPDNPITYRKKKKKKEKLFLWVIHSFQPLHNLLKIDEMGGFQMPRSPQIFASKKPLDI